MSSEKGFATCREALLCGQQRIVLNFSQLSEHEIETLINLLGTSKTQAINLYSIHSMPQSMLLFSTLRANSTLHELDLENYLLGNDGLAMLCDCLKVNIAMHRINLIDNLLHGAQAGQLLSAVLTENSTLVELQLGENEFGDEGAQSLAVGLEVNTSMQTLNMRKNEVTDLGATAIINALPKHRAIKFIYLGKEVDRGTMERVHARLNFFHALLAMRSANACKRVSARSYLRRLPLELARMVGYLLEPPPSFTPIDA